MNGASRWLEACAGSASTPATAAHNAATMGSARPPGGTGCSVMGSVLSGHRGSVPGPLYAGPDELDAAARAQPGLGLAMLGALRTGASPSRAARTPAGAGAARAPRDGGASGP